MSDVRTCLESLSPEIVELLEWQIEFLVKWFDEYQHVLEVRHVR